MMTNRLMLSALMLSAGLAACGGSDDEPAPMPPAPPPAASNEVPASAMASPRAYSQYAGSLAASDTTEPLDVDKVVPPTSEADEPIDLG